MRTCVFIMLLALALLAPKRAWSEATNSVPEVLHEDSADHWSFTPSLYGYIVPESRDYVNPNLSVDRGRLHLEARYNYEALDSGSLWVGYNFHTGENLVFEITPMVGGVFGHLSGVAPGCNFSLSYKRFSFSSQSELVFDASDSEHFFYTWTELTYSPWEWLRAGVVIQRTRAYKSDLDVQRGFLVGVTYKRADFAAYVFNLGWTDPTIVLATSFNF